MQLSKIIAIWEELHVLDTGDVGFSDLERAVETVDGVENDIDASVPAQTLGDAASPTESELERLRSVIGRLALYFISGTDIPVERATIPAKKFWEIVGPKARQGSEQRTSPAVEE